MKRTPLLNRHLSQLIASLGHLDEIILADAGLPVPPGVPVIDLAVTPGVPGFWDVLDALCSELVIDKACYASEGSDELQQKMANTITAWGQSQQKAVTSEVLSHDGLKLRSEKARAIIRTGECTPYCNIVLISGVPF